MKYETAYTAIAFSDIKQAALYFDFVLPIGIFRKSEMDGTLGTRPAREITSALAGPELFTLLEKDTALQWVVNHAVMSLSGAELSSPIALRLLEYYTMLLGASFESKGRNLSFWYDKGTALFGEDSEEFWKDKPFEPNLDDEGLLTAFQENWSPEKILSSLSDQKITTVQSFAEDHVYFGLRNLVLVDTQTATWEQIFEFRKDAASKAKLHNLRLMLYADYSGRDRRFVEDDIARRIEEHRLKLDEWGFETKVGALLSLLSWKALGSTSLGVILSTLYGAPLTAVVSSGIAMTVGATALELSKRFKRREILKKTSPVSYLVDLEDRFGGP